MATITVRSVPEELLESLKKLAEDQRRSLTQQVVFLLEQAVERANAREPEFAVRQAESWRRLAGRWRSDESAEEEIDRLFESRTEGREVDL